MTNRRWFAIAAATPVALLLLMMLTLLFIPDRELEGVVQRGLAQEGYTFRAARFGKAFPLGIAARDVRLATAAGDVLQAREMTVRLRILPLFTGNLVLDCRARIGSGDVRAEIAPFGEGELTLRISGLNLEEVPFFTTVADLRMKGVLEAKAEFVGRGKRTTGELRLATKVTEIGGAKLGDLPLPDATYRAVQGMLRVNAGKITLESFTLDGEGLYARLKGDLPLTTPLGAAPLNLALELMPKADFLERQKFVFLLLVKYQKSPGHFEIPIRGQLRKPAVS
jgi:type II secretion system protein N